MESIVPIRVVTNSVFTNAVGTGFLPCPLGDRLSGRAANSHFARFFPRADSSQATTSSFPHRRFGRDGRAKASLSSIESARIVPSKLVADAMARGAAGILTEQILPCPLPQCIVGDIELALARITAAQTRPSRSRNADHGRDRFSWQNNHDAVGLLAAAGMRHSQRRTKVIWANCDGVVQSTSSDIDSGQAVVGRVVGEASDSQCQAAIIELSDDDARHGHYDAIEFDMVIVTGSATCSGDYGPSGIQCVLERLTNDGVVIAPVDDEKAMRVIARIRRQMCDLRRSQVSRRNGQDHRPVGRDDDVAGDAP